MNRPVFRRPAHRAICMVLSLLLLFNTLVAPQGAAAANPVVVTSGEASGAHAVPAQPSLEQAEAQFYQALNRMINTPADAPSSYHAAAQRELEQASERYQQLQAQAAATGNSAPTGGGDGSDRYLYTANTSAPNGDTASWMLLGKPQGNRNAFDQAFSAGLSGQTAGAMAPAPAGAAHSAASTNAMGPAAPAASRSSSAYMGPLAAAARPCGKVKVRVTSISVTDNSESDSAEWRMDLWVNGSLREWNADGVQDRPYGVDFQWTVDLNNDGDSIHLRTGGYEEDSGFNGGNDPLSTLDLRYGSWNNYGIGSHNIHAGNADGDYWLGFSIECIGPMFADLRAGASASRDSLPAGDQLVYTFTAYNDGMSHVDDARINITLPAGVRNVFPTASQGTGCVPSGGTLACTLGRIDAGRQATVSVQLDTPEDQTGAIAASVGVSIASSGQVDPSGGNNGASKTVTLLPKANTGVTLAGPVHVLRNHTGATSYQVTATVSNAGPTYAPGVRLTPTLPPGVSVLTASPSTGSCNGSTGVCNLGDMAVNRTATVLYTLGIDSSVAEGTIMTLGAGVAMTFAGATEIDTLNNTASRGPRLTYWDLALGASDPGGEVHALAYIDEQIYAGGTFGIKYWNGTAWTGLGSGGPDGTVYALLPDGAGGLYAGGTFTNIGPRLAHWNGSGWSAIGGGVPNGAVYALARDGDTLYVGGQFSQAGTLTTNNVARWDGTTWRSLGVAGVTQGFGTAQPQVRAILVDGAYVYVGGLFKIPAPNIARWHKDLDAWEGLGSGIAYPGGNSVVHALALLDGRIYAGGRFATAGGQTAPRIGAYDIGAQRWMGLGSGIGGTGALAVNALSVTGGELVVGGTFTTAGGAPARHLARWNGAAWTPLGAGADASPVNALAAGGEPLSSYVGGLFTAVDNGVPANHVGQYHHAPTNLVISQSMTPDPPVAGAPLEITLNVTNLGALPAKDVVVRDELPGDASFTSVSASQGTCANTSGTVVCTLGEIAPSATVAITLRADIAPTISGPFANRAWVGARQLDQAPADNRIAATPSVVAEADLAVTLDVPTSAIAGRPVTYTLGVQNNGPARATDAELTLTLPTGGAVLEDVSGLTCEPKTNYADLVEIRCALGTMDSGASQSGTLRFNIRPETLGAMDATAAATSLVADDTAANSSQTRSTTVVAAADLGLTLTAPNSIYQPAGEVGSFSYDLALVNAGPSLARDITATLTLPAATTFVAAAPGCTPAEGQVICVAGDLEVNETVSFAVEVYVNPGIADGAALDAAASVTSTADDAQLDDNATAATTAVVTDSANATVDLRLSQTVPATVNAGETALFTLNVYNQGAVAGAVAITDTLPLGASFDPSLSDPDCFEVAEPAGTIVCQLQQLEVGSLREIVIAVEVPSTTAADEVLSNTATASVVPADEGAADSVPNEANADDNTATAETTVTTTADLLLTQEASHTSVAAGEAVTFTLTLENLGPSLAWDVTLENVQPDGMVLDSVEATQGSCAIADEAVSCTLGALDAGEATTVEVVMLAGSGAVTNTATASSTTDDRDTANNEAAAELEIAAAERSTQEWGALSVTADTFVDLPDGRVQAFGDVWLGEFIHLAGETDSVVFDGEEVTGEGTIEYLQEKLALFTGDFTGAFGEEAATLTPGEDVEYQLGEISGFHLADVMISEVDLLEGRASGASEELAVETEGFSQTLNVNLFVEPGPVFGGTVESFEFAVGSVAFVVEGAELKTEGLGAETVTMTLPEEWGGIETAVTELSITADGVSIGGASATIPLPDFSLAGDKVQLHDSSVTIVFDGDALMLSGEGTLALNLPDNAQEIQITFSIDSTGQFSAGLDTLTLQLAGASLELSDLAVNNDGLSVAEGILTLPASLNESTVTVREVSITADGLEVGGGEVKLNLPDIDIGDGSKVRFSEVVATLAIENGEYTFGIESVLQLRLPQNAQDIRVEASIDTTGAFSGKLDQVTIKIASASLQMVNVAFDNEGLAVEAATLALPEKLGGGSGTLNEVRIGGEGLSIGGGSVRFAFPDIKLGSANGFSVTNVSAMLELAADRSFKLTLEGIVQINVKSVRASVKGAISVDSQGRFSGRIDEFFVSVSGLEVLVRDAQVNNGELSVAEASLKAPASWGGAEVAVYNLRISSAGVRIGGGRFAVPDIKAGSVSLGSLYGELREEGNGYVISVGGKFRVAGLGGPNCMLAVGATMYVATNGSAVVQLDATASVPEQTEATVADDAASREAAPQASSFQLRHIGVGLSGCRVPIGATGFYLTRVQGSLTLSQTQTIIDLGVTIANDGDLVRGDADMRMQFNPWQMDFAGSITLFSVFKAAELKARIRSGYFSADLRLRQIWPPIEGQVSVTAWTADGSFHLVGRATVALVFREGSLWEECVLSICLSVPPFDVKVAEIGAEFGEFRKGGGSVWGLKGWASVWKFSVGFYVDTEGGLSVGNVDGYQLITPPSVNAARALAQKRDTQSLTTAEQSTLDTYTFQGDDVIINQPVGVSTDLMFVLARKGDAPQLTLIDPAGRAIGPDNLPANVTLVDVPADGGTQTLYVVKGAAAGNWQAVLSGDGGDDYLFRVLGANPAPEVGNLAVGNTGPQAARADWTLVSDEITTTMDIFVTPGPITATHTITGENGLEKTIEVPLFSGFPLAEAVPTTLDGSASQVDLDLSKLETGTYWVWFSADDGRNPPVRAYAPAPIIVSRPWSNNWTAEIDVKDHFRGFDLSWNRHPNPDVDGYRVEIGTQPGLVDDVYEVGDVEGQAIDNLLPGQVYYLTLVGVDEETGRTSRSETRSAVATGASFDLLAPAPNISLVAGESQAFPLVLQTTVDPYPTVVRLAAGDLPDGVDISFDAFDNLATPSIGGTVVTATLSTTASMVGGVYDVPLQATGDGLQDQVVVRLTVQEPRLHVTASASELTWEQQGASATVLLSAQGLYGATGAADLDLLDVPTGLAYAFSAQALPEGGSVTLALNDTARLENGSYTLRLRSEVGLQQQIMPLTLVVRKPDFRLVPQLDRLHILAGERAVFPIAVDGEYLAGAVTLRLDAQSSPVQDGNAGFAATAARAPQPSLFVAAGGTGYFAVETGKQTPAGTYRFVVEGQHGERVKQETINVTVWDEASSAPGPDLRVSHGATEHTAVIGDLHTYTLEVVNYGPVTAEGVVLTDELPLLTSAVKATPSRGSCQIADGRVVCDLLTLRRGARATVSIQARVSSTLEPGTELVNRVDVTSATGKTALRAGMTANENAESPNTSIHTATTKARADLVVSIAGSAPEVMAGGAMSYNIVAWNGGPSLAKDVRVVTTLPAGQDLLSLRTSQGACGSSLDRRVITCELGDLSADSSGHNAVITLQTKVSPGSTGSLQVAADVAGATTDLTDGNNSAIVDTRVLQNVDLQIVHEVVAPAEAIAGDELTYRLNVVNKGQSDATAVVVTDTLPEEMEAIEQASASQGRCAVIAGQVTCSLGTLGPQATATVMLRVRIDPAARSPLHNVATVSSAAPEATLDDNRTSVETALQARADLALAIAATTPASFQFVVDNLGPSDAHGVVLTATLPDTWVIADVLPAQGSCTVSGGTISCDLGTMRLKDRVVIAVRGTPQPGASSVEAVGSVRGDEHDPRQANNEARAVAIIPPVPVEPPDPTPTATTLPSPTPTDVPSATATPSTTETATAGPTEVETASPSPTPTTETPVEPGSLPFKIYLPLAHS